MTPDVLQRLQFHAPIGEFVNYIKDTLYIIRAEGFSGGILSFHLDCFAQICLSFPDDTNIQTKTTVSLCTYIHMYFQTDTNRNDHRNNMLRIIITYYYKITYYAVFFMFLATRARIGAESYTFSNLGQTDRPTIGPTGHDICFLKSYY